MSISLPSKPSLTPSPSSDILPHTGTFPLPSVLILLYSTPSGSAAIPKSHFGTTLCTDQDPPALTKRFT